MKSIPSGALTTFRALFGACAVTQACASPETTTWYFTGAVESTENQYVADIQDPRFLKGIYQDGNRVSGNITFSRQGQDFQEPTNPDPGLTDDPDRAFYYQVVQSMEFQIDSAGWPGAAVLWSSPPPPPLSGNPFPGSIRIINDEEISEGVIRRDSLLMHAPLFGDDAVWDPETSQMVPVKLCGWDAIPGTRAAVLAFLYIDEIRTDGGFPSMVAGDGLDFALPDPSQSGVSAILEVRMTQVPNTGESFRVVVRIDSLSETAPPAPWLRIGRPDPATGEMEVEFIGFITTSENLHTWTPMVPQPASPFMVVPDEPARFFRALR